MAAERQDRSDEPELIELAADWPLEPVEPAPRRLVLAAAVGESPAVVSETLWALFNRSPSEQPERIVIFTTAAGRQQICGRYEAAGTYDQVKALSDPQRRRPLGALKPGHRAWEDDDLVLALARLCREWRRPVPIVELHVARDERGRRIEDIRTESDDRAFGNLVFRVIRRLTEDDGLTVHASIAGGRKTMGTRLAGVLAMFGRPQDELSHVLVTKRESEGSGYWCPSKEPGKIRVRRPPEEPRDVEVGDASVVQLVSQRFWPLRSLIDDESLERVADFDFDEVVLALQAVIDPPPVCFHDTDCEVQIGIPGVTFSRSIKLEAKKYARYRLLAESRVAAGSCPLPWCRSGEGIVLAGGFGRQVSCGHGGQLDDGIVAQRGDGSRVM